MEIKKTAIVVKCDKEEKEILEKAFRIVAEIEQNPIIRNSCSHSCPFRQYCNLANNKYESDCFLDVTLFNLKEILNKV